MHHPFKARDYSLNANAQICLTVESPSRRTQGAKCISFVATARTGARRATQEGVPANPDFATPLAIPPYASSLGAAPTCKYPFNPLGYCAAPKQQSSPEQAARWPDAPTSLRVPPFASLADGRLIIPRRQKPVNRPRSAAPMREAAALKPSEIQNI